MHCFYHVEANGQGQCQCGKVLCADCMTVTNTTGLCSECAIKLNSAYRKQVRNTLILSLVFGALGLLEGVGQAYLFFAIFWGRQFCKDFLNRILDGWIVTLNIYLFIVFAKIMLYGMVGLVVAPFAAFFSYKKIKTLESHNRLISENQIQLLNRG